MKITFDFNCDFIALLHDVGKHSATVTTGDINPTGRAFVLTRNELAQLVTSAIATGAVKLTAE